MTKGLRQQLRDVLDVSESGASAAGLGARSSSSGRLQDMQPAVLSTDSAAGGGAGARPSDERRRVAASDFPARDPAPSANASGVQNAGRSPLRDGPVRSSAHYRASSKMSSVMSAMPWHRNKEGGDGTGGSNEP